MARASNVIGFGAMYRVSSQHSDVAGSFSGSKERKAGPHKDASFRIREFLGASM